MATSKRLLITGGSGFIGTNFVEHVMLLPNTKILNLDAGTPHNSSQAKFHLSCDILNATSLTQHLKDFGPTHVVHLAGRTDMDGEHIDDYAANHIGTSNLLTAIQAVGTVERAVFTSSQFVVGPGAPPSSDLDYRPHTLYGQSKVLSERAVRDNPPACVWTIIRPTNIWGKWHPRYTHEFWKVLADGLYVHPSGKEVRRCYGYVGTVIEQILGILDASPASVCGKTLYVGDPPIALLDWVNAFSRELTHKNVRQLPYPLLNLVARFGDLMISRGRKFPLFTSRLRSMTENYLTPMEPTFSLLGYPKTTLQQGVAETAAWLRSSQSFDC